MKKEEALELIFKFFDSRSPFEQAKTLVAHASSGIPDIFIDWLRRVNPQDRTVVIESLLSQILMGTLPDTLMPRATAIMVDAAVAFPGDVSERDREALEAFMSKPENLITWANSLDSDNLNSYSNQWRFALSLWNIVRVINSPIAEKLYRYFLKNARDQEFVRSLELAKRIHEYRSKD